MASRTLLTEVDVDNSKGDLLSGAYVSVHIKLPSKAPAVTIPVNTLIFRSEGLRVAVVRDGKAQLTPFIMGRDFGKPGGSAGRHRPGRFGDCESFGLVDFGHAGYGGEMTRAGLAIVVLALAGCTVGPKYQVPTVQDCPRLSKSRCQRRFRDSPDWKAGQPSDAVLRPKWWEIFGDTQLNALEEQVDLSNQNLKVSEGEVPAGAGDDPVQPSQPAAHHLDGAQYREPTHFCGAVSV